MQPSFTLVISNQFCLVCVGGESNGKGSQNVAWAHILVSI